MLSEIVACLKQSGMSVTATVVAGLGSSLAAGSFSAWVTHYFAARRAKRERERLEIEALTKAYAHYLGDLEQLSIELPDLHVRSLHRMLTTRDLILPAQVCNRVYVLLHRIELYQVDSQKNPQRFDRVDPSEEGMRKLKCWLRDVIDIVKDRISRTEADQQGFLNRLDKARTEWDITKRP